MFELCGQDGIIYEMQLFMNEQRRDKINKRYEVTTHQIKPYIADPLVFSRPLGINYTNVFPNNIYNYKTQPNYTMNKNYQPIEQPIPQENLDSLRNSLSNQIESIRNNNKGVNKLYN